MAIPNPKRREFREGSRTKNKSRGGGDGREEGEPRKGMAAHSLNISH